MTLVIAVALFMLFAFLLVVNLFTVVLSFGVGVAVAIVLRNPDVQHRINDRQIWELGLVLSVAGAAVLTYLVLPDRPARIHYLGILAAVPAFMIFGSLLPSGNRFFGRNGYFIPRRRLAEREDLGDDDHGGHQS